MTLGYSILNRGVRKLERQQRQAAGYEPPGRWHEFLVRPSCPPDKRVHISGGIVTPSAYWGFIQQNDFLPEWVCDFEEGIRTGMNLVFTNANYYLPIILCYWYDFAAYYTYYEINYPPDGWFTWEDQPFDNVIGTEVATTVEAEAQIDAWMNGSTDWYKELMPLWGIVFKNDGQTEVNYAILPIDAVNRGRSYLYRDCRARHDIAG